MTTKGTLPPQAYTREQLAQAFQWVQSQPEIVRKSADTPDVLVGMYLKAKRGGDFTVDAEAPISAQTFKENLKSLAAELQQFSSPAPTYEVPYTTSVSPLASQKATAPLRSPAMDFAPSSVTVNTSTAFSTTPTAPTHPSQPQLAPDAVITGLDSRSLATIKKVQERFNLSSETEALRMLIAMGAEKLQPILG